MDGCGEIPDPTHRILKDVIRYGIGAWVLFLGGVGYYFYLGGEIPFHDEGQSMAFGFTGYLGFVFGAPFALRALWVVLHQKRDDLDSDGDDLWRLAAGLGGSYSILVLLLLVATFLAS
jgi:hypothetical protein